MKERYKAYERWNISLDSGKEFRKFKNRLINLLTLAYDEMLDERIERIFANKIGEVYKNDSGTIEHSPDRNYEKLLLRSIDNAECVGEIGIKLQYLIEAIEERHGHGSASYIINRIKQAIDESPTIEISGSYVNNKYILYPGGAEFFDEKVINESLSWLESVPEAGDHFRNALSYYLKKDKKSYRNLLDELRSALERLMQNILNNSSNLENQKKYILKWMESQGAHVQIINLFERLLACYIQYYNDAVKHCNEWSEKDIEYMIYQTGIFIRLLLILDYKNNGRD